MTTAMVLALIACDSPAPTEPLDRSARPDLEISDGANGGNAHFFFLPPLVPSPSTSGSVDPSLAASLRVEICDLGTSRPPATESCGASPIIIAAFTSTAGTASEVLRYTSGQYAVNWHTDQTPLQTSHYYRLRVLAGGTELGQADIDPVRTVSDLRNYDTGNSIPLVN